MNFEHGQQKYYVNDKVYTTMARVTTATKNSYFYEMEMLTIYKVRDLLGGSIFSVHGVYYCVKPKLVIS